MNQTTLSLLALLTKTGVFLSTNKPLQGVLFHGLAIILVYHAGILLQRLEVPMPGILLHLNDIGAMRQVVGDVGRAQVVDMTPRYACPPGDGLVHLLHRPILERLAGSGQKDSGGLTLRPDLEIAPDRLHRFALERQLLLIPPLPRPAHPPAPRFASFAPPSH